MFLVTEGAEGKAGQAMLAEMAADVPFILMEPLFGLWFLGSSSLVEEHLIV